MNYYYFNGDSITVAHNIGEYRWSTLVSRAHQAIEVNHGVDGMPWQPIRPQSGLLLMRETPKAPATVFIAYGTNDAIIPIRDGAGRVPNDPYRFAFSMYLVVQKYKRQGNRVVLVTPPPTYIEEKYNRAVSRYQTAVRNVALWTDSPCVDLKNMPPALFSDGIHPTIEGHKYIASIVMQVINRWRV